MKRLIALATVLFSGTVFAEGNQVFYRYGIATLKNDRGGEVFTDTGGAAGKNDGTKGWNLGAGLDIQMMKDVGPGDVVGEVMVDYAHWSKKKVRQTTSALLSGTNNSEIAVTGLAVVVAPKYRFHYMEGKLRPWIIPIGLAFLVNSPPSNDTGYLDIGYHAGLGVEYAVLSYLSLGLDYRYTFAAKESAVDLSGNTMDVYAGVNF